MRWLAATVAAAGFLVLFGAGCGGIDKGKLESAIQSQTNDQLEKARRSERVATVSCAKSGDAYHYDCDLQNAGGTTFLSVRATCTKGGTCRWKPA
jgi:predicted secreted protein